MSDLTTTIQKVISKVDEIKVNAYSPEKKTEWINKVEGMIQSEIMGIEEDQLVIYNWGTDADTALLVKHPYNDIYEFYVEAMIDYYNKEISSYENSMMMFNNAFDEYSNYYKRVKVSGTSVYIKNIW
jgi:hypothetical protein